MTKAQRLERREIYSGRVIDLAVERLRLPNGSVCDMEMVHHRGAAAVVPVDADGQVILVRQYRHAVGGWLLEVPAGKLDGGEAPDACAERELAEETGFAAGRLVPLDWIWTTPGFSDEKIWLFLAVDLTPARQSLEVDECLTVERLPFDEAVAQAARGEIRDGKSVCALHRARYALDRLKP